MDTDLWEIEFLDCSTNETSVRYSRVLLAAAGFLDIPKAAENIANIPDYQGRIFHSSDWDHEVDFKGKNVVVVGNGASATQIVPWLLENTGLKKLVQVVRSAQWIAPKENQRTGKVQKWQVSSLSDNYLAHE